MEKEVLNSKNENPEMFDRETIPAEIENAEKLWPFLFKSSGLYVKKSKFFPWKPTIPWKIKPVGAQSAFDLDILDDDDRASFPLLPFFGHEEFRLDVDGRYPLMTASGYLKFPGVYYIAKLSKSGKDYIGKIWYKHGNVASFQYKYLKVELTNSFFPNNKKAKVTFSGGGTSTKISTYNFSSTYFRKVDFEFDYEQGVNPVLNIDTHDHPNRPVDMPSENLTLNKVYQRAGFNVTGSGENEVPAALKGANGKWSNMEMHDAMQAYWSKFNNAPNWAMWVFFAQQHDMGSTLGGIMFDDIGANHRQGTAIFNDSFINEAPVGDSNPAGYIKRMKFWTATHEMGHSFNLAHSWQKNYPNFGFSWLPLVNDSEARSFMNYPYNVSGGQSAFFGNFENRFTDNELLFMRHAPNAFVQMGNSDWFDNHAFENENMSTDNRFALEVSITQPNNTLEYLEPAYLKLSLRNTTGAPIAVDSNLLKNLKDIAINIETPSGKVTQVRSFVEYLFGKKEDILMPNETLSENHFISAGSNGWYIKDSGGYTVSAMMSIGEQSYISNALKLEVLLPQNQEAQMLSTQYFTEEVARVLYFNGSRVLTSGNETLEKVLENVPKSNAAVHAAMALSNPYMRDYKLLNFKEDTPLAVAKSADAEDAAFKTLKANKKKALSLIDKATSSATQFTKTYGAIATDDHLNTLMDFIKTNESAAKAGKLEKTLRKSMKNN